MCKLQMVIFNQKWLTIVSNNQTNFYTYNMLEGIISKLFSDYSKMELYDLNEYTHNYGSKTMSHIWKHGRQKLNCFWENIYMYINYISIGTVFPSTVVP